MLKKKTLLKEFPIFQDYNQFPGLSRTFQDEWPPCINTKL